MCGSGRVLVAVLAVAILVSCGASGGSDARDAASESGSAKVADPSTTSPQTSTTTETSTTTRATTTTTEPPDVNPKFGESFSWEDGITLTVGNPAPFTPNEYAAFDEAPAYVVLEINVKNGSSENFDPSMISTSMQSGSAEASAVYDSQAGIEGSPSTTLLPGRDVTFKVAFGVANPDDLILEVSPSFEYESALFTS